MILLSSALHGKHLTQENILNQFSCNREGRVVAVPVSDCQKRSQTFASFGDEITLFEAPRKGLFYKDRFRSEFAGSLDHRHALMNMPGAYGDEDGSLCLQHFSVIQVSAALPNSRKCLLKTLRIRIRNCDHGNLGMHFPHFVQSVSEISPTGMPDNADGVGGERLSLDEQRDACETEGLEEKPSVCVH